MIIREIIVRVYLLSLQAAFVWLPAEDIRFRLLSVEAKDEGRLGEPYSDL